MTIKKKNKAQLVRILQLAKHAKEPIRKDRAKMEEKRKP